LLFSKFGIFSKYFGKDKNVFVMTIFEKTQNEKTTPQILTNSDFLPSPPMVNILFVFFK
jgi:hypothetical protein